MRALRGTALLRRTHLGMLGCTSGPCSLSWGRKPMMSSCSSSISTSENRLPRPYGPRNGKSMAMAVFGDPISRLAHFRSGCVRCAATFLPMWLDACYARYGSGKCISLEADLALIAQGRMSRALSAIMSASFIIPAKGGRTSSLAAEQPTSNTKLNLGFRSKCAAVIHELPVGVPRRRHEEPADGGHAPQRRLLEMNAAARCAPADRAVDLPVIPSQRAYLPPR